MSEPHIFRSRELDRTIREVEMTAEQARTLVSGQAVAYYPRDERIVIAADGAVVRRESAVPVQPA